MSVLTFLISVSSIFAYLADHNCLGNSMILYVDQKAIPRGNGTRGHPYQRIQDGIDAASNGGTVLVADGIYAGVGNVNLDFNGKSIILRSENGAENCIIDCESADNTRGFHFHSGEDSRSVVNGFTIRNGRTTGKWPTGCGGGIECTSSSPTIINNIITGNRAQSGGGIRCDTRSCPTIDSNIIAGNSSIFGAGIWCTSRRISSLCAVIINNIIAGNSASAWSGGISCAHDSSPLVAGNIIMRNSARLGAGGIRCIHRSSPLIRNNLIAENHAFYGGGIHCSMDSSPIITSNTITGNSADLGGGISCYRGCYPTVVNTILWNNTPQEICLDISMPKDSFQNTISGVEDCPSALSIYCSVVQGGQDEIVINDEGAANWHMGNMDVDPLFTDTANGDYRLSDSSPCSGAGFRHVGTPAMDTSFLKVER